MSKQRNDHPDIAPAGPTYSRSIRCNNWLFISGCTARGTASQGQRLTEQIRVTLDRISRIVEAEGGTPSDIVKLTTFVKSIDEFKKCNAEWAKICNDLFQGQYPTNTLVEITALFEQGLDIEIEAIAIIE